ncbi:hypothetical protein P4S73_16045 [Paraglaciecola sp. Hal342]
MSFEDTSGFELQVNWVPASGLAAFHRMDGKWEVLIGWCGADC